MEFRMLGAVELWAHGEEIPLPTLKLKQLYAALLWDAGKLVPSSTLERRIWGDDAPPRAPASIQSNVTKLRKCLGQCGDPTLDVTQISIGYRLLIPADCVDKVQFERKVALADSARRRGNTTEAIRLLRSAEALVRGEEPLAGLLGPWAAEKRAELQELIRRTTVDRVTLQIESGEAHAVLPELSRLVTQYEFDEAILELYMRTLSSAGRTTEALDAYAIFQSRLRGQKGLEPRASLKKLQVELLRDGSGWPRPPTAPVASPRTPPPNTLDHDLPNFVGRSQNVDVITTEIEGQSATGAPVVCAIDGMPGIGKTTLAVHLSRRLTRICPDGAFQLHMRAHDEHRGQTDPESALGLLLEMLGVEPSRIQRAGSLDYLIALWRKHTSGKRLVLLLDDVASADQITPLIPSGAGSVVLVTSRNRLAGLPDALRHTLEAMPDANATELFINAARMSPTSDPALDEVVAACVGFPIALAIAGNHLRTHPTWSLRDLADHLADTLGSPAGKPDSITTPLFRVFSTSYRGLPEPERTLLRRLSLNPEPRTHFRAAAALADMDPGDTDRALLNLVDKNLLKETGRRNYQLHDMIRAFSAYMCDIEEPPAERAAAAHRLVHFTLGSAAGATKLFHPQRHVVLVDRSAGLDDRHDIGFTDVEQATSWLDSEKDWLLSIAEHWFGSQHAREAASLAHMLSIFLDRRSSWRESARLHERALATWQSRGERSGVAHALTDLATCHWRLGAYDLAMSFATDAISLWRGLAEPQGIADALLQQGRVHLSTHHYAAAIESFTECARLREAGRDAQTQAVALQHLGIARFDSGDYQGGVANVERALHLARSARDPAIERNCINSLGEFWLGLGDYAKAEQFYRQALPLTDQVAEARAVATVALNLSECSTLLHRADTALPLLDRAFEIYERIKDIRGQTNVMIAQGRAHMELGRIGNAKALIDSAAATAEQTADSLQLARVHMVYGQLATANEAYGTAASSFRQALNYAVAAGTPLVQASALRQLGDAEMHTRGVVHARNHWHKALSLYGAVQSPETDLLRERLARPSQTGAAA